MARAEVHRHSYLISEPHLRNHQGEMSALSTPPKLLFSLSAESFGLVVTDCVAYKDRRRRIKKGSTKEIRRQSNCGKEKTSLTAVEYAGMCIRALMIVGNPAGEHLPSGTTQ